MSKLELGLLGLTSLALVAGCDDRSGDTDAGPFDAGIGLMDSGPPGDSGPPIDTGLPPGTDAGPPSGGCGPTDGPCNVGQPGSCGPGMACVLNGGSVDGWTTICITEGVIADGQPCMSGMQGQCQQGSTCNAGVCERICCGNLTPTGCTAGATCVGLTNAEEAGYCTTGSGCVIDDATSCGATQACFHLGTEGETDCFDLAETPSQPNEACEGGLNTCVAGYVCTGENICREYCVPDGDPCPDTFMCGRINNGSGGVIPGVGFCVPVPAT